ncbi:MAG: DUF3107 domain-containing protein [Actinomycetota bacterium]
MEVKIGVQNTPREIVIESSQSPEEVAGVVDAALADGTVLRLTDDRGRVVVVPVPALAYVEIGVEERGRVGFGAL